MVGLHYNGDDADIFVICHLHEFKEISVEWKIRGKFSSWRRGRSSKQFVKRFERHDDKCCKIYVTSNDVFLLC